MPVNSSNYNNDAILGAQIERLVQKALQKYVEGSNVIAEMGNNFDARLKAVEDALKSSNVGAFVADSVETQSLKVGGEDVASAISGKAASDHTHVLTFSTSSGTPDYTLKDGDIIAVSAGGTTKKIKIVPDFINTVDDPFIPPDVAGSMWRNAMTGDIWIADGSSRTSNWVLVHNRIHDLIVQRQSVVIGGQGASRPILCDKQNYTTNASGQITFARVDPYEIAKWKNRGDVIQFGGEVDYDPWGDGYPMRMTEYQAAKDSNNKWYCTNINLRGYKYNSATEGSYWGNINHDDDTDKDFIEFQGW